MSIPNIPEGRTENYLGNLIGQETAWEPGNPESRVEEYLDYILNNGTKLEQEMEDEIANLKAIGRFLSLWNAATGLPTTEPSKLPYKYKAGDYYIVGVVGATNYQPTGTKYEGTASTSVYSGDLAVNDFFVYDGSAWTLLSHSVVDTGSTFEAFPASWPTSSSYTTAQFCAAVNSDADAVQGKGYLGEVRWSDLPSSMVNAEVQVEIMSGTGTSNKTIHLICTSGNRPPYRWEYTYWNNGSNTSGWVGFQPEPFNIPLTMDSGGSWSTTLTFAQIRDAIKYYGTNMTISMEGVPVAINSSGYDDSEGEGFVLAMMINGDGPDIISLVVMLENSSVDVEVITAPLGDNTFIITITENVGGTYATPTTPTEIAEALDDGKRIVVVSENAVLPAILATNDDGEVMVEATLYDPESGGIVYFTISGDTEDQSCVVMLHEYSGGGSAPFQVECEWQVDQQTGDDVLVVTTSASDVYDALSAGNQVVVVVDDEEHYNPTFTNCNSNGTRIRIECASVDIDHNSVSSLAIYGNKNSLSAEYDTINVPDPVPYFEIPITEDPNSEGTYITGLTASDIIAGVQSAGTNINIIVGDGDMILRAVAANVDLEDGGEAFVQAMFGNGAEDGGVVSCSILAIEDDDSVTITLASEIPDTSPFKIECEWGTNPNTGDYELSVTTDPAEIVEAVKDNKSILVVIDDNSTYVPAYASFEAEDDSVYILCQDPDTDHSEITITIIRGDTSSMSAEVETMNVASYSAGDNISIQSSTIAVTSGNATSGKVLTADGTGSASWETPSAGMTNPMTTAGDVIVGGSSGAPTRLAKGSDGQVLKMVSGSPAWAADSAGMTNPMTTAGDIIVGGSSGTPDRLAKGSNGTLLGVNGSGNLAYTTGLPYTTTAPTAANTDGIKIAVLSSDPATKYNGWLYIITGA